MSVHQRSKQRFRSAHFISRRTGKLAGTGEFSHSLLPGIDGPEDSRTDDGSFILRMLILAVNTKFSEGRHHERDVQRQLLTLLPTLFE
jgi:hypothetical protein